MRIIKSDFYCILLYIILNIKKPSTNFFSAILIKKIKMGNYMSFACDVL